MRRSIPFVLTVAFATTIAFAVPSFAQDDDGGRGTGTDTPNAAAPRGSAMDDLVPYVSGSLIVPFGDLGDVAGIGIGVGGGVSKNFTDAVDGRAEISIFKPSGESFGNFDYSVWVIPVSALAQFSPAPDSPFYLMGGLSLVFLRFSYDGEYQYFNGTQFVTQKQSYSDSETKIGIVGGGGVEAAENLFVEATLNLVEHGSSLTAGARYAF